MTVAIDRLRSGDSGSRAAARRAEAAALQAADRACEAYRSTLSDSLRDTVRPDRVVAVVDGAPGDALATAVADLGSAAYAAARAAHLAVEAGREAEVRRTSEVAQSAAAAADQGVIAMARRDAPDAATQAVRMAHAAAMVAHLTADALESYGAIALPSSLLVATDHPSVPFPPSWRRRIERLAEQCASVQPSEVAHDELRRAAMSACAAAQHALQAYMHAGKGSAVSRALGRVTRIAALAACYAGAAALDLRR